MAHPDDYQYYLNCGCEDVSHCLGFQSMPDGYALMLDADQMYFFWMEKATGRESSIHHDRWAVRRGAISDAARRTGRGRAVYPGQSAAAVAARLGAVDWTSEPVGVRA